MDRSIRGRTPIVPALFHRPFHFTGEHHYHVDVLFPAEAIIGGFKMFLNKYQTIEKTHVQKSVKVAASGPCVAIYRRLVPSGCTYDAFT